MTVEWLPIAKSAPEGRSTIAMRVYRALREAIVTMRLLPGNSPSEAEVAKRTRGRTLVPSIASPR